MNKILAAILMVAATSAMADGYRGHRGGHSDDAGWFVGGMVAGAIINEASQPRVIYQPQPQVIIQQAPQVVQMQPMLPAQQYILVQPQVTPRSQFLPPAYLNGAAFCPGGMTMYQRIGPYGNVENLGCSY